jgi:hypothetical protein
MGVSNKTLDNTLLKGNSTKRREGGVAGVVIDAGQALRLNTTTNRYVLAQADAIGNADLAGIAEHPAGIGQPISLIWDGEITGLTGLTAGESYVLSDDAAGDIMEIGDLTTGHIVTHVGVALTTTSLFVRILASGVAHA